MTLLRLHILNDSEDPLENCSLESRKTRRTDGDHRKDSKRLEGLARESSRAVHRMSSEHQLVGACYRLLPLVVLAAVWLLAVNGAGDPD